MKAMKKVMSMMLALVMAVTSVLCCGLTAGATSEYDLIKEMKKYKITSDTLFDGAVFGYYERTSSRYDFCFSGLSTEGGDALTELIKGGSDLSVLFRFDTGLGIIYEGKKKLVNLKRDNQSSDNYPVNLELKYFKKAGSVYRLGIRLSLTNDILLNKDIENAVLEAKAATLTVAAAAKTGERTYYDKKKVFYIPFTDKYNAKTVERIDINSLAIAAIKDKTYNGEYQEPDVVLKSGTTRLKKNVDYMLTYRNNVAVGTATVVIKGRGDYKGTMKKTFNIVPKKTRIKSTNINGDIIDITWSPITNIDLYGIFLSEDNGKTFKLYDTVDADTTKYSMRLPMNADYTIKVATGKIVGKKTYYSNLSDATQRFQSK